jgi:hypothetical protein
MEVLEGLKELQKSTRRELHGLKAPNAFTSSMESNQPSMSGSMIAICDWKSDLLARGDFHRLVIDIGLVIHFHSDQERPRPCLFSSMDRLFCAARRFDNEIFVAIEGPIYPGLGPSDASRPWD